MVDPAIAVAADVPVARSDRRGGGRVGFERLGAAENGHWHAEASKDSIEAPEADARAVLEHAFGGEVAARDAQIRAQHLGQPAFRDAVSRGIGKLRALLEIDHEVDGNAGVPRPLRMRRLGAVADKIAGHIASVGGSSLVVSGYQSS